MAEKAITVENLGKMYNISRQGRGYQTLRDKILSIPRRLIRDSQKQEAFWALKDVSFEIEAGERVGIIGRNGAGKSTLLKLLSRITKPTHGRALISGRVASLLEVGTGFHPELTGRENIFMNGALLGMTRSEIQSKFDEIVVFAEIEQFIDTPVKRYSSGMYVRLAFAVAAHLEPEILFVDEVLAVGDAQFQKKCLGKMENVSKEKGRTVLFVSHNMAAVQRLCTKGIFLNKGKIQSIGYIHSIIDAYQRSDLNNFSNSDENRTTDLRPGEVRFVKWSINKSDDSLAHTCLSRDVCEIVFEAHSRFSGDDVYLGFALWTEDGNLVLAGSSQDGGKELMVIGTGIIKITVCVSLPIRTGRYRIDVSINSRSKGMLDRWDGNPMLTVLPSEDLSLPDVWHGIVNLPISWSLG